MKGERRDTRLSLDISSPLAGFVHTMTRALPQKYVSISDFPPPGVFFLNVFPALVSVGNPGASCGSPRHITRYPSIDSRAQWKVSL